jgi:peptidoglycan/xylan/chitin deacetylase (PgdA/CDA1 family)
LNVQPIPTIPILAFHKVNPAFEWGVTRSTPGHFRRVLEYLKKNRYTTVSLEDLIVRRRLPARPVVLTFDDAYDCFYRHALPLLDEFGFKATLFVITGYVGRDNTWDVNLGWLRFRHLSWDQIHSLSLSGMEIGSHTVRHADLTALPGFRLRKELRQSKAELEEKTGRRVRTISFPFGRYNSNVLRACVEAGYDAGCGFLTGKAKQDPFVFQRKAYYLIDGIWTLKAKLSDGWAARAENAKLRFINFCSHGTSLVKPPRWDE